LAFKVPQTLQGTNLSMSFIHAPGQGSSPFIEYSNVICTLLLTWRTRSTVYH